MLNLLNPALQVDTDFSNDSDVRAVLIVHDTKPPFLDGRVSFPKQSQAVMPIRDSTSAMAVIGKSQFITHLKKAEVRHILPLLALVGDLHQGRLLCCADFAVTWFLGLPAPIYSCKQHSVTP